MRGADAIALGDIKAARDCLVDAIQLDPRNRKALEALGYCYLKLSDVPRATRSLEGALVVPGEQPGRSLSMNLSYVLLRNRNAMRAAKVLKDYLAARPTSLDQEALDALAICLGQAPDEAKVNRLWDECTKFYEQYNARLEATRPGEKRWGVEWIAKSDWEDKDKANKQAQKELDEKAKELSAVRTDFNKKKALYDIATSNKPGRSRVPPPSVLEPQLREGKQKMDELQAQYTEIAAKIVRPTLPKLFEPVPLEDTFANTAVAVGPAVGVNPAVAVAPPVAVRPPVAVSPPVAVNPPVAVPPGGPAPPTPPPVAVAPPPADPVEPAAPRKRTIFSTACGFAVAPDLIVTTAASVEGATRVSVQPPDSDPVDAEVVRTDGRLALLRMKGRRMRHVGVGDAFPGGPVQCVSFPTPAIFDPAAEVIAGTATAVKDEWSISLARHPRLAGAPILFNGRVVGVELASREDPSTKLPAASLSDLKKLVAADAVGAVNNDPRLAVCVVSAMKSN